MQYCGVSIYPVVVEFWTVFHPPCEDFFLSIRHLLFLSCMANTLACLCIVKSLTIWYAFLVLFLARLLSMSAHFCLTHSSLASFMPFLIHVLVFQYSSRPSCSFFLFFNSLYLSHNSSSSFVTHSFILGWFLPRTSVAVSVTAWLKVLTSSSRLSVVSSNHSNGANLPLMIAWKELHIIGSLSFSRLYLAQLKCAFLVLHRYSCSVIITRS